MDPQATHLSGVYSGTLTHLAPEALQFGRQSKAADVYAFGMVMYELFSARRPYDKMSSTAILEAICYKGQRPVLPATVPVKIVELYDQCTAFVPDNRPVAEEVVMMVSKLLLEHAKDPLVMISLWFPASFPPLVCRICATPPPPGKIVCG